MDQHQRNKAYLEELQTTGRTSLHDLLRNIGSLQPPTLVEFIEKVPISSTRGSLRLLLGSNKSQFHNDITRARGVLLHTSTLERGSDLLSALGLDTSGNLWVYDRDAGAFKWHMASAWTDYEQLQLPGLADLLASRRLAHSYNDNLLGHSTPVTELWAHAEYFCGRRFGHVSSIGVDLRL